MKIGLIDVDGKLPNLALMKVSAYHRAKGNTVIRYSPLFQGFDIVYSSKVFTFTEDYASPIKANTIIKGGSGYNFDKLPTDIEECKPDYYMYPDNQYDIGFISRGCLRKCEFCSVPKKEGKLVQVAEPMDIYSGLHKKIMFLDNNFTALPNRIELLKSIIDMQKKYGVTVTFKQGLDARLFDEEFVDFLSKVKYDKQIFIALDNIKYVDSFMKGADLIKKSSIPDKRVAVYILAGYKDTLEDILERIEIVFKKYKFDPYIMPHADILNPKDTRSYTIKKLKQVMSKPNWIRYRITRYWDDFKSKILS